MPDEKKPPKEFLNYEDGEIKRVEAPPPENFDDFVDGDEDLGPVADLLKNINKEENESTEGQPKRKIKKQYIDLKEHKHIDETTDSEETYMEETPPPKKETVNFKLPSLPFRLTPYSIMVGIMAFAIIFFLLGQKNGTHISGQKPIPTQKITVVEPEETEDPTLQELTQLSTLALNYTSLIDTLKEIRASEIKVTYGYIDGSYTKDQVKNMVSQAALTKDTILQDLEKEVVLPSFSGLNTLAQRYVRSELNSSKQVMRDLDTSQKPVDIYTSFSGGTSTINTHITNMCNELETLLKNYGISYTRSGNKFEF